jgi:hypothetical protein
MLISQNLFAIIMLNRDQFVGENLINYSLSRPPDL